ncbi:MAG: hypothetical protein RLZZ458_2622 [Planctomycetota bacterium]
MRVAGVACEPAKVGVASMPWVVSIYALIKAKLTCGVEKNRGAMGGNCG